MLREKMQGRVIRKQAVPKTKAIATNIRYLSVKTKNTAKLENFSFNFSKIHNF